jgi:hypothetical protein
MLRYIFEISKEVLIRLLPEIIKIIIEVIIIKK